MQKVNNIMDIINNVEGLYEGDLQHYFAVIMNAKNATNGYHNARHNLHVLWEGYDALKYYEITGREARTALISLGLHDLNHTGDAKVSDFVNIDLAVTGMKKALLPIDKPHALKCEKLIRSTQYPYLTEPANLGESIMRDADLSGTFASVWIQPIIFGFAQERKCSYKKMLKEQIPFLQKIHFYTEWAEKKFTPLLHQRISEVEQMQKILLK